MSYQFYKIIHVVSIVVLFSGFSGFSSGKKDNKFWSIVTGIALIFILISGVGILHKLGISFKHGIPSWITIKFIIWLFLGFSGHFIMKRYPAQIKKFYWSSLILLALASYLANYKTLII